MAASVQTVAKVGWDRRGWHRQWRHTLFRHERSVVLLSCSRLPVRAEEAFACLQNYTNPPNDTQLSQHDTQPPPQQHPPLSLTLQLCQGYMHDLDYKPGVVHWDGLHYSNNPLKWVKVLLTVLYFPMPFLAVSALNISWGFSSRTCGLKGQLEYFS